MFFKSDHAVFCLEAKLCVTFPEVAKLLG